VVPVIQSAATVPKERQHRAKHNGGRLVERAEFHQQHGEYEQDGRQQHHDEIAERFLLLLVQAAVFDRAGRQPGVLAQLLLDFFHRAAQIAAFQPRGDDDVLPQIVADQSTSLGSSTASATCESRTTVPLAARNGSSFNAAMRLTLPGLASTRMLTNAVAFQNGRHGLAQQCRVHRPRRCPGC